jgi:hypothetical protein
MNEELQSKLVEVLTGISEGVAQAKDFAVEQLPDVAQQYIMFGMVWETALFTLLVIAAAVLLMMPYLLWSNRRKLDEFFVSFGGTMSFIMGVVIACFAVGQLKPVLLVWFAPKLYLLQGIAGLVK